MNVEEEKKAVDEFVNNKKYEDIILFYNAWKYYIKINLDQENNKKYEEMIQYVKENYPFLII